MKNNNSTQPKIAVVYARYSCDRQNEQSIDGQLRVCKDFADKNNITIVNTYIDKAISGTHDNRDAFQQMLKDSDNKEWNVLLVYKLDRFSRNKYEMAVHRKRLADNGIKIVSAMENIPDSPEGILLESLLEGMNQYYSEELSQKTKRGMHEMRLKGNFIGGFINYGWSLQPTYIEQNGKQVLQSTKVVINEDEAPIVRQIFTDYAAGKKATTIAYELNQRGIRNRGNLFQTGTIYSMLRQEKYTGIYRVNDIAYDKIYPQIVPVEIYNIVRAKIEKNKHGKGAKQNHIYLLKGKMFCGCCGRRMTSYTGSSRPSKLVRYYSCARNGICSNRTTVRKEILEQGITASLDTIFSNKENFDLLVNSILTKYNQNLYDVTGLRLAEKELAKIHTSITNLFRAVENGFFSDTTNTRIQELEKRKAELIEYIATEKTKEVEPLTEQQVLEYITTAKTKDMQTVIDMLVRKVIVQNDLINVYLKYDILNPKDDNPKHVKDPTQILSEQGLLLFSYSQPYFISPTNKTYLECIANKELSQKEFIIKILL